MGITENSLVHIITRMFYYELIYFHIYFLVYSRSARSPHLLKHPITAKSIKQNGIFPSTGWPSHPYSWYWEQQVLQFRWLYVFQAVSMKMAIKTLQSDVWSRVLANNIFELHRRVMCLIFIYWICKLFLALWRAAYCTQLRKPFIFISFRLCNDLSRTFCSFSAPATFPYHQNHFKVHVFRSEFIAHDICS